MNTSIWPQVFEYRIIRSPLHLCTIPGELQLSVGREILTDWNCLINIELATLWKTNRHKIQRMHSQSKSSQYHVGDSTEISRRGAGCLWIMRAPSNAMAIIVRATSKPMASSKQKRATEQSPDHRLLLSAGINHCPLHMWYIVWWLLLVYCLMVIAGILSDGYCSFHFDFVNKM